MNHLRNTVFSGLVLSVFFTGCSFNKYARNYTHPDKPRYAAFDITPSLKTTDESIKIVTYNIKNSHKIDEAIKILKTNKQLSDAGILCIQELDLPSVKRIADALKLNYVYYPAVVYKEKDFGPSIFTKYPVLNDEKIILPHLNQYKAQRIATSAVLEINNKKVKVFSVHLSVLITPSQRGDQISKIEQALNPDIDYFIVAGDFNTITKVSLRTMLEPLLENYFTFATKDIEWTYKHWYLFNKKAALDHILTKGMKIINVGVVEDNSASDHIPVFAELQMLSR